MTKPIIEGADGVTLTSTGLIAVREHSDFVDNVLAGKAADKERTLRLVMTLNHEGVHFIQCFTATFPYSFSLSLLEISSQIMKLSRRNALTPAQIRELKNAFGGRISQFRSPHRGISTIDLLEAMAVTEGYRATVPDDKDNANDFRQFLLTYFPKADSEYRRVIDLITDVFGVEAGYHLTSRLCYISLNGDHPAKNLSTFIEDLASDRAKTAHRLTAVQILDLFGMDISASLLRMCEAELPSEARHPIFTPYMQALSRIGTLEERYEFSAQPGNWLGGGGPDKIGQLVPPLVVCSGGKGRIMGLASDWSKDEVFFYLDRSAMIGACLALLSGDKHYQTCQHTECPVHESTLCHSWFAKPHSIPWKDCVFPARVNVQFGVAAEQLVKDFSL
ncbi:MAG: hypothetical protein ACE5IR_28560 [bacterium]